MVKRAGMEYMKGYSQGYKPPTGSAGGEAKGEYSHSSNPRPVPKKGSSIGPGSDYGTNADRSKVMSLKDEQAKKENLRGMGC